MDTVRVGGDAEATLRREMTALQMRLLERDALLEELSVRLDEARREVVRAMAKLQTSATRAEAASAIAEAEVALRQLQTTRGSTAEVAQAERLLALSGSEFESQNYGGAVYLANEAKNVARRRAADTLRPGETPFAAPVPLRTTTRSNVRDGPGIRFRVLFTLDAEAAVLAHGHLEEWVRITDEEGRTGWIFHTLVSGR